MGVRRGSMLMEATMAIPPLILIFMGIVQFVCLGYAKLMTEYAAFTAVRVAEVTPWSGKRQPKDAARDAARRVLVPVSWSYSQLNFGDKNPGTGKIEIKGLGLNMLDFPPATRQPLGWFPLWNAGWIEDQVAVTYERPASGKANFHSVEVRFKCPLHVPVVADILVHAGVAKTFRPHSIYGKMQVTDDIPYLELRAKRLAVIPVPGEVIPKMPEGSS